MSQPDGLVVTRRRFRSLRAGVCGVSVSGEAGSHDFAPFVRVIRHSFYMIVLGAGSTLSLKLFNPLRG